MKYYLLSQDLSNDGKWVLGDINHVDNWLFRNPTVDLMEPGSYSLSVRFDGDEVDFSLAGYASVPVVGDKVVRSLAGLPEVDELYSNVIFSPVEIENRSSENNYFIMIVETQVDCVDEERSDFSIYSEDDPVRPDLAGNYRSFFNLVILPEKIDGRHIFRLKRRLGVLIVSEEVKRRFECAGVTGVVFKLLNGSDKVVA
ncbi:hypothetical protein LL962_20705 [Xanthomonas sp. NCPPB 1067]|uniref:imm11 family protein n=1 Tax=Xanthomonas sp. NCPPB 1067 TaxID=487524 RepID=UPI001E4A32BC|nr:DUF1629 domain-containing protein [Xanthomonas sp. NCPPB 1067]MCC4589480.1 hypothetical protein [Xanthomonas sp. NCPPB 1067]